MGEPILIIGGGIGGLAAALALVRSGQPDNGQDGHTGASSVQVKVFERAPELNEVGAGITLWSNATLVLDKLGVLDRLRELGHQPDHGIIGTHRGRVLSRLDYADLVGRTGMPRLLAMHRADLQRVLYEALPDGVVTLGAECTEIGQDEERKLVTARFSNGEEIRGRLLVGADGIRSVVRARLWGDADPRYAGYTCWRGVTAEPPGWNGTSGEIWGRGQRFGIVPIGGQRLYWFATANATRGTEDDPQTRQARLLERFADWAFGVPDVIAATPAAAIIHNDIVDRPPGQQWTRGRVTLLGDAAHATTPNLGQGAAMAIEDGIVLARALTADDDATRALRIYESARMTRTTRITRVSWSLGRMAQWENGFARWLRDHMFAATPKSISLKQIGQIAMYDAWKAPLPRL